MGCLRDPVAGYPRDQITGHSREDHGTTAKRTSTLKHIELTLTG